MRKQILLLALYHSEAQREQRASHNWSFAARHRCETPTRRCLMDSELLPLFYEKADVGK
jgi:hypothetical protein